MRKYILFGLLCTVLPVGAASLPDDPLFNAMKDEMQRSVKLQMKGSQRPYYIMYKVEENDRLISLGTSFGEVIHRDYKAPVLNTNVLLSVGNEKTDSFGMEENSWYWRRGVGKNYDDIRHSLWERTNVAYLQANRLYEKKQSYLRGKNTKQSFPDFIPGPQGMYVDEEPPEESVSPSDVESLAKRLSAKGKRYPFIEKFELWLIPRRDRVVMLNNLGAYADIYTNWVFADLGVDFRTKEGFEKRIYRRWSNTDEKETWEHVLEKQVDQVLEEVQKMYEAKQGTAYIGPVLLSAPASASLWQDAFVQYTRSIPLISSDGKEQPGGSLKDKIGLRIVAPFIDVYDKPSLRTYNHQILAGFSPLDDEGVVPQELTLVKDGFLRELPTSSRPFKEGIRTNGHGFALLNSPGEFATNIVVEPHEPLSQEELEKKLLEMCREQELEYGYILYGRNEWDDGVALAERIYVADGHKEPVYGLRIETDINPRLLRDIRGAGDEKGIYTWYGASSQTVLSPALLFGEMELVPTNKKPDRKPFVPKP